MKKKILVSAVIVAAFCAASPALDGLYVRHILTREISKLQEQLTTQLNDADLNINFAIADYHLGYFSSDVDYVLTLTSKDQESGKSESDTFKYKEHIVHGPIVKFKNQWTPGLAVMDIQFNKADLLNLLKNKLNKDEINKFPDISGTFSTLMSLSGSRFEDHYVIAPVTLNNAAADQKLSWDGMTGDFIVAKHGDKISKFEFNTTIGKVSAVDNKTQFGVEVAPIQISLTSQLSSHDFYNGNFKIATDKVSVNSAKQEKKLVANNIQLTVTADSTKDTYGYRGDMTVAKMDFPVKLNGLNSISNLKYHGEINNLSLNGYQSMLEIEKKFANKKPNQFEAVTAAMDLVNAYFKLLTNSSNVVYQISSETNLGNAALDVNVSLDKLPLNYFELASAIRVKATASAAQPLVQLIENSDDQTKQTIDKLVQNQLLIKNSKDYVLNFSYSNSNINISGKDFKDFAAVDKLLRQVFSTK